MKPRSKCYYCAHLFNIDECVIRKNGDIIKSDNIKYFSQLELNKDVIQCPKCNSWIEIKHLTNRC